MNGRLVHIVNAALLGVLVIGSAIAWPSLPARIPHHFDLTGRPDAWTDNTLLAWFGLPLVAILVTAMFYIAGRMMARRPDWINVPDKNRFIALPPERKARVVEMIRRMLLWLAVPVIVLFILIQVSVYEAAHGRLAAGLVAAGTILCLVTAMVLPVVVLVRVQREMTRA